MRAPGLVVLLAFLGCRSPADAALPHGLILCSPPLSVQVDTAAGPRFTWTPGCGATYLEVTSPDRSQVFWAVQGDTGKVAPGVTYGVAPPAYRSTFGPFPLVRGTAYAIRVGIMVEEASFAIFGEQVFTR